MSDERKAGDRNCPTCRGTGVRDCSGSIIYDNDGKVRSSTSATTPCHCVRPAPAVPDDVAGLIAVLRERQYGANVTDTLTRWDRAREAAADTIEAQAAELARLRTQIADMDRTLTIGMQLASMEMREAAEQPAPDAVAEAATVLLADQDAVTELAVETCRHNQRDAWGNRAGYRPSIIAALQSLAKEPRP